MTETNNTLDHNDARILAALLKHPRATVMGLAHELRLARSTVQIRLARLDELGVLSMENVHTIPGLAGYGVTAFMTIEVHQRDLDSLRQGLATIPEVIEAYGTTGDGDVMCRVVAAAPRTSAASTRWCSTAPVFAAPTRRSSYARFSNIDWSRCWTP